MLTKKIKLVDYLALYENAVLLYKNIEEPIPQINKNSINKISYILEVPFQNIFGKVAYWGFYKKAAIMFYLMTKNHALDNGNKRLACMSLMLFYEINDRELKITDMELYNLSKRVAISAAANFESVVIYIKDYLRLKR